MSLTEVREGLEREIREQKSREEAQRLNQINMEQEENIKRQMQTAENMMRNEIQERVDDFENPHERSMRYFRMEEINSDISREKARAHSEQDRNMYEKQAEKERGM